MDNIVLLPIRIIIKKNRKSFNIVLHFGNVEKRVILIYVSNEPLQNTQDINNLFENDWNSLQEVLTSSKIGQEQKKNFGYVFYINESLLIEGYKQRKDRFLSRFYLDIVIVKIIISRNKKKLIVIKK